MSNSRIVPIPAVNGVIFNRDKKVLLTRRSPIVREPGKWCLPGGHLEMGENWETAIRREINEEVGVVAKNVRLIGIYSDPELTVTREELPAGYRAQFVVPLFLIESFTGEVTPNEEVDMWGWFAPGQLPSPIMKSHPVRVQDAFSFRGEVFVR